MNTYVIHFLDGYGRDRKTTVNANTIAEALIQVGMTLSEVIYISINGTEYSVGQLSTMPIWS